MNMRALTQQRRFLKMIVFAALLVFATAFIAGCGYDEYVTTVREGSFNAYPKTPIGDAFDDYFKDGEWKSFKSKDGDRVVEFNGVAEGRKQDLKVKMQFIVYNDDSFELHYVSWNGKSVGPLLYMGMIDDIMEEYNK
ncbi:MAG: hypothetical protein KHZ77_03955 [Veillonella sp.]|uniref:hypothetical protein n=1 Tax=Veillonella sp. TaxID=1926307 RepID=UPI0025F0EDD1|nr:hypothetical protein [Veillonella sp.]MBS4913303.1 hypothetical protein [Veillonella sp.]